MLLKFIVKNYKSYRSETTFDFTNTPMSAYTSSMLVGDVATGKSNFIDALTFVVNCVTQRYQSKLADIDGYLDANSPRNKPYMGGSRPADNGVSTFTVQFTMSPECKDYNPFGKGDIDPRVYEYSFTVTPESIIGESLYFYNVGEDDNKLLKKNRVLVFEREYGKKLKVNDEFITRDHKDMFNMMRGNVVTDEDARKKDGCFILHDGAHMKCKILEYVYTFFHTLDVCTFPEDSVRAFLSDVLPEYLHVRSDTLCKEYAKLLREFTHDDTISDIFVREENGKWSAYITHTNLFVYNVVDASEGVQKALLLVHVLKFAEMNGGVVVIDDIDKHVDDRVCLYICVYAQKHGIQIVGTTSSAFVAGECTMEHICGIEGAWLNVCKNELGISNVVRNS